MQLLTLFKKSFRAWQKDKAQQLAASTAYYTVFSLAPLLIIIISIASFFFASSNVQEQIIAQMQSILGPEGAGAIASMLAAAHSSPHSALATILGVVTLILGATGLLVSLQDAVNTIWNIEVKPDQATIKRTIVKRFFSLGLILVIGFLLVVSLAVSAGISFFSSIIAAHVFFPPFLLWILDTVVSVGIIFILFALLIKFLPDLIIPWKVLWPGALLTSLLFTLGKILLGWYFGQKNFASAYGIAGSLIILLLWINYSAQIFFFGVEFTKVRAEQKMTVLYPKPHAQFVGQGKNTSYPRGFPILDAVLAATILVLESKVFALIRRFKKKKASLEKLLP